MNEGEPEPAVLVHDVSVMIRETQFRISPTRSAVLTVGAFILVFAALMAIALNAGIDLIG